MFKIKKQKRDVNLLVGTYFSHIGGSKYKVIKVTDTKIWLAWKGVNGIDMDIEDSAFTLEHWDKLLLKGAYYITNDDGISPELKEFKLE